MATHIVEQSGATVESIAKSLQTVGGRPFVLSTVVAQHFDKKHFHVMRDIRDIMSELPEGVRESNFGCTQVDVPMPTGGTRKLPAFLLSRDGFTLLAMGFTGKKALAWKICYIAAFNAMEAQLARAGANTTAAPEALPKPRQQPRQKALPAAPGPDYREKCAGVTAQMLALRGQLFQVSQEMMHLFSAPFWGPPGTVPEDKKPFATHMNYAVQSFFMAVNKDLEAAELLFNAYVEGEKILHG